MSEFTVYEISYRKDGLDAMQLDAAKACVDLANNGGCGGKISPFYSVEEAARALDSVATKDEQARLQLFVNEQAV